MSIIFDEESIDMKFQNCILINFERAYGRMDNPKAICPFNFLKVEGITIVNRLLQGETKHGEKQLSVFLF